MSGRRLLVLLVALAAIGIPAGILQALCVGRTCDRDAEVAPVPFCPLPPALRTAVANGYREGRSPDVLAVAASPVFTEIDGLRIPWPALPSTADARVPLAFVGAGAAPMPVPAGTTLDAVAPTVAAALGFERPFPEVRSGEAVDGIPAPGEQQPRLILLIGWKGVGSAELEDAPEAWPFLASAIAEGAGTLEAETGSLPNDPAATLATIGIGGLPAQHGITGSVVRTDEGVVVDAFADGSPVPVIASLADDLEEADARTLVGLVATSSRDRGLVGGGWYPGQDPVDVVLGDAAAAPIAVDALLTSGFGSDAVPDVLGVVLEGGIERLDRLTRRIVVGAQASTDGRALVVVAGTGGRERSTIATDDRSVVDAVEDAIPGTEPAVAATVPGGLFLDQEVLRRQEVTGQVAVRALLDAEASAGERMFVDAFQGFTVSFSRYC